MCPLPFVAVCWPSSASDPLRPALPRTAATFQPGCDQLPYSRPALGHFWTSRFYLRVHCEGVSGVGMPLLHDCCASWQVQTRQASAQQGGRRRRRVRLHPSYCSCNTTTRQERERWLAHTRPARAFRPSFQKTSSSDLLKYLVMAAMARVFMPNPHFFPRICQMPCAWATR